MGALYKWALVQARDENLAEELVQETYVKEGIEKMNDYSENSYRPEILTIGMDGRKGQHGEPFSCVKSSLDQNILILAYDKPATVSELARTLGTPMAFVEESVNNLVDAQLMTREGRKVATNFFITSLDDMLKAVEVAKRFAAESFSRANQVIWQGVEKYEAIEGFSVFSTTQKYLCAVLSLRLNIISAVVEAITGEDPWNNDFPDRPNYGKWLAYGNHYPHAYHYNDERGKYSISGRSFINCVNEYVTGACEWNSPLGPTHFAQLKYNASSVERAQLIDAVRTNTVNAFQAELLPDMERYGFIKEENGIKIPAVPYIAQADEKIFFDVEREMGEDFCNAFLNDLSQLCKENKVKHPKRIPFADGSAYDLPLCYLPMAYVYEAAKRGIITIEEGKYYPVMYLIWK